MTKDKPPLPIVKLERFGFVPVTPYDAEIIEGLGVGSEYDLKHRSKRSDKHHRTYWKALGGVVKATGAWPTSKHLHRELKLACGYVEKVVDWNTGEVYEIPDSTAFDKMTQPEFKVYFDTSMGKLAEKVGFDPLEWLDRREQMNHS